MLILPFALALGVLAGIATGGSLRALGQLRFRFPALVLGAIALQAAVGLPWLGHWPSGLRFALVVVSYLMVGGWLLDQARHSHRGVRSGYVLVTAGWVANLLAIVSNGGMPVSRAALIRAGLSPSTNVAVGHLSKHVAATSGTRLAWLGDTIPVAMFRSVISPGDIVMALGIVVMVAAATRTAAIHLDAGRAAGEVGSAPKCSDPPPPSPHGAIVTSEQVT